MSLSLCTWPASLHAFSVCPSLYLSPPLCRLSLLWLRSRACGGWTSVSWLRIEPCCASSPASLSRRPCRRQRTSDPLTSSVLLFSPLLSPPQPHNFYTPLSFWCLYSPLVLCCVFSGRSCTLPMLTPLTPQCISLCTLLTQSPLWPSEGNPADPTTLPQNISHKPPLKCIFSYTHVTWGFTWHEHCIKSCFSLVII